MPAVNKAAPEQTPQIAPRRPTPGCPSDARCAKVVRVDPLRVGIRQCLGVEDEETGKEQGSVENRLWQRHREYCQEDGSSSEPADGCPANSSAVGEPPSGKYPRTAPRLRVSRNPSELPTEYPAACMISGSQVLSP